jgi:glycosyltransferase involved in cell wall biosynthesis
MSALVSCIIPVFNGERFVREAIESVLAQRHRPLELIVVDDGSTDGTANVVRSCGEEVRYIFQSNSGPTDARNRGLAIARGELIAFLDADDLWHEEKLERQLAVLAEHPEVDCCLTHVRLFWEKELSAEEARYRHAERTEAAGFAGSTMLVRRRAFEAAGLFLSNRPHSGLVEWFARSRAHGVSVHMIQEVLAYRRMHAANLSRTGQSDSHDEMFDLIKRRLDRHRLARKVV